MGSRYRAILPAGVAAWIAALLFVAPAIAISSDPPTPGSNALRSDTDPIARGDVAAARGDLEQAAAHFADAAHASESAGRSDEQTLALLRLGEVQASLGRYSDSARALEQALSVAGPGGDPARRAAILGALGNTYVALDASKPASERKAVAYLEQGIALAKQADAPAVSASLLVNLGNELYFSGHPEDALSRYDEAASLAKGVDPALEAKALTNAARIALDQHDVAHAADLLARAQELATALPDSHEKAYLLVSIGRSCAKGAAGQPALLRRAVDSLTAAANTAEQLQDPRAASWAWGYLGEIYESRGRSDEALALTRRAIDAAQRVSTPDSLYRWQWQEGRILARQGDLAGAAAAYGQAVDTLEGIRHETVSYGPSEPFNEVLKPVYYGRVDLLLRLARDETDQKQRSARLADARRTLEKLKRAEVRDYFRDDCVDSLRAKEVSLDDVSRTAAIVYPILLPDRTEFIVSVGGELVQYSTPVGAAALADEVHTFRQLLEKRTTYQYLPHARQLYDWLVRPYADRLQAAGVDTLVIVPDGPLRNIPLGALHDGDNYLIARYAIATTPGLDLIEPRPIDRAHVKVLLAGLSESVQSFEPLPLVREELSSVGGLYANESLIDSQFTRARLAQKMRDQDLDVVHIASHGQFGGDVQNTFLLTHDGKLTMADLDQAVGLFRFRDKPLELLTLSACETAAGDDRAALGLAGVAVKAGARSVLATLWTVSDRASSELVTDFYRNLRDASVSRAVALQRAQLALIAQPGSKHPAYWAAFILISGWL